MLLGAPGLTTRNKDAQRETKQKHSFRSILFCPRIVSMKGFRTHRKPVWGIQKTSKDKESFRLSCGRFKHACGTRWPFHLFSGLSEATVLYLPLRDAAPGDDGLSQRPDRTNGTMDF